MAKRKLQHKHFEPDYNQKQVRAILVLQRQNDIVAMLLGGKDPSKEIKPYIIKKYNITPATANFYVHQARNIIKERKNFEVNNLISLHISRYELMYGRLVDLKMHSLAMNVLRQKEKLMGFHKQGFHMRVNQGEIQQIQNQYVGNEYDLDKLSQPKRERMDQLLVKAKKRA